MDRRGVLGGLPVALLSLGPAAGNEFRSARGNITCHFHGYIHKTEDSEPRYAVRCDIAEYAPVWTTPPEGCKLDWGGVLWLEESRPGRRACVGDAGASPAAPVLEYGDSVYAGFLICEMQRSGVTCTNDEGHGFFMSRATQRVF